MTAITRRIGLHRGQHAIAGEDLDRGISIIPRTGDAK
jgi:hypothetical protein